jgi:hypothetical protein
LISTFSDFRITLISFSRWCQSLIGDTLPSFRHGLTPSQSPRKLLPKSVFILPGGQLNREMRPAHQHLWGSVGRVLVQPVIQNL